MKLLITQYVGVQVDAQLVEVAIGVTNVSCVDGGPVGHDIAL